MALGWEYVGKSPITLVREELARRYIQCRQVNETFVNYDILVDIEGEPQEVAVSVIFRNNSLFFMADLLIECPDDMEILANVANIAYDLYMREQPFYGRILVTDEKTYYQLNHILGDPCLLDPAMVALLLDLVQTEILEIITEEYAVEQVE
ncbi:MAG: hypothetical protein VB050_17160 [Geobacteraceae bacterium]|nr:hypothetical protein [Geobacteraceae bacterium]